MLTFISPVTLPIKHTNMLHLQFLHSAWTVEYEKKKNKKQKGLPTHVMKSLKKETLLYENVLFQMHFSSTKKHKMT